MEIDSCNKVLGMEGLLGEILQRLGCTKSFVRSGDVNSFWLATVRTAAVADQFAKRNQPSFLGFVNEFHRGYGLGLELIFHPGATSTKGAKAMRGNFTSGAITDGYVVAPHGGCLVSQVDVPAGRPAGFHISCPYSKPHVSRFVGTPIPSIPRNPVFHTDNTYEQYGVIPATGAPGSPAAGFFVKDLAGFPDILYQGVRFNSAASVYVHVCIFENNTWRRIPYGPLSPPSPVTFHRNPYCVLVGNLLYLMYLVGTIVCFDIQTRTFSVVELPVCMSAPTSSFYDYTVAPDTEGDLALVHFKDGILDKWVLVREDNGSSTWSVKTSFDIADTFWKMGQDVMPMQFEAGHLTHVDWGSVQVRSASPGARYIMISVAVNDGLFIVDMMEQKIEEVTDTLQGGWLGIVFPLTENWPPKA